MSGEIAHDEESFMSMFANSQRRSRRNGLCNIFEGILEDEEMISFQNRLIASSSEMTDENGDLGYCNAMDSSDSSWCDLRKDADFPGQDCSNESESDRLSGLPEESSPSLSSVETARPSCLVGLKASPSNSSSSSSSSTSPSSMSSKTSSSVYSSCSSSSSIGRSLRTCSPDDNTTSTHGFVTSPSTSSLCYEIAFTRVRRNALHDLFETLTQDDLEKLKNLYQTALSTAYTLKPFSEQTQSPIRGFHECKA